MKKMLIPFLLCVGIVGYLSCQKEHSSDANSVKSEKTDNIKKGEPVEFSVNNLSGEAARWSVSPSTNVQLSSDGNKATIFFGKAGSYAVTALMGNATARVMVTVNDSTWCDSTHHNCDSIPRDSTHCVPRDSTHCAPRDSTHTVPRDTTHTVPRDTTHTVPRDTTHTVPRDTTHYRL